MIDNFFDQRDAFDNRRGRDAQRRGFSASFRRAFFRVFRPVPPDSRPNVPCAGLDDDPDTGVGQ